MTKRRRARPAPSGLHPFGLWAEAMATGVATAVTLSVRVPRLLAGTLSAAEATRMVGEKLAAAGEGCAAGAAAAARVTAKRLARPAPHRAEQDALEIAEAATRPARRRVKANAARLSGS